MISVGLAGLLVAAGKTVYEEFGINELIMTICGIIAAIGAILVSIAYGQ